MLPRPVPTKVGVFIRRRHWTRQRRGLNHQRGSSLSYSTSTCVVAYDVCNMPYLPLGTNLTTMSRKRPGTTADWIKLLSYIFIKWLSTFWCSGWPYGCILTSSKPWRYVDLAEPGYKPYHYDMVEAKNPFRMDNTSILYVYKVFKHHTFQRSVSVSWEQ